MGIDFEALQGMYFAKNNGVDFSKTVTIGRQCRLFDITSDIKNHLAGFENCAKNKPSHIFCISKKIGRVPENLSVLQSDYVETWNSRTKDGENIVSEVSVYKQIYRKIFPKNLRDVIWRIRNSREHRKYYMRIKVW